MFQLNELLTESYLFKFVGVGFGVGLLAALLAGRNFRYRLALTVFPFVGGATGLLAHAILILSRESSLVILGQRWGSPADPLIRFWWIYPVVVLVVLTVPLLTIVPMRSGLTRSRNSFSIEPLHARGYFFSSCTERREWARRVRWLCAFFLLALALPATGIFLLERALIFPLSRLYFFLLIVPSALVLIWLVEVVFEFLEPGGGEA